MLSLRNLLAIALSTLVTVFVASTAPAADSKPTGVHKSGRSTGLLIADAARDAGAAFARDRDKCDQDDKDKDKGHGGVRSNSSGTHKRPDCDDDDDDDDDCDGHGHRDHGDHHKKPKECRPSPSR